MFNSYNGIKSEYEQIRLKNIFKYDEKRNGIYAKNPKLEEYDIKLAKLRAQIVRDKIYKTTATDIEPEIAKIKTERAKYLKEHGIVDDYLDTIYDCKICKDTGYVNGQKCSCFVQKEIELFDSISHFKNYIKDDNFDNLDMRYYRQSDILVGKLPYIKYMENAIDNIKSGIKLMGENPYNCILMGGTGTGKTFLARCAGAEAIKLNKSVLYLNVNEYINSLKPDFEGEPLKQYAVACDLFILDDLGTERISEYTNTEINYIIDKRLNDKKSTIITTNLQPDDIQEKYLPPTYSRLQHMYIQCRLFGEDLRRLKNANI